MTKNKCDCCGDYFDREEVSSRIDDEYGLGTYEHCFQWNDFCFECADERIQDGAGGMDVYDAALIWVSRGRDEDYMYGYTEYELENALR